MTIVVAGQRPRIWATMRATSSVDEQPLDGSSVVVELVVAVLADLARVLHAIERRLVGEAPAGLVEHGCECGIVAQRVVVDQVLVAERQAEYALAQQVGQGMPDRIGEAHIGEATGETPADPDRPIRRRQQHDAAIRGDRAAVESVHKPAPAGTSQIEFSLATLCRHRGSPPAQMKSFSQNNFLCVGAPMRITPVRSSG